MHFIIIFILNRFILPIDRILTCNTTLIQIRSWSKGNNEVTPYALELEPHYQVPFIVLSRARLILILKKY